MTLSIKSKIVINREYLEKLRARPVMQSPLGYFSERRIALDRLSERMLSSMEKRIMTSKERFSRLTAALDAMSPLKVLARGYAINTTEDGRIVKKTDDVKIGEKISVQVQDGNINCTVCDIERRAENE